MTALCPLTSFPDQYDVQVSYIPAEKCIESKSAKFYFGAFRDYGGFIETIAEKILADWMKASGSVDVKVDITMNPRGGVAINVIRKNGLL
jgi:7-cyano-7-deazaguanine reductase